MASAEGHPRVIVDSDMNLLTPCTTRGLLAIVYPWWHQNRQAIQPVPLENARYRALANPKRLGNLAIGLASLTTLDNLLLHRRQWASGRA